VETILAVQLRLTHNRLITRTQNSVTTNSINTSTCSSTRAALEALATEMASFNLSILARQHISMEFSSTAVITVAKVYLKCVREPTPVTKSALKTR